ncbi:hypothetical protein [Laribacter hongkongensis]|uniref:hypothetical protein n=1 Tax=Laribacter hongkongensis TaxID=168471 RepID=UPI001EFEC5CC|nr:hypothetical protein [Laribacter hongkongensis]MCG9100442.1 hypothetical protein [Laribacter hongkongensis]MCG9113323.1 hypothetical protein [Laribacter hongkongensis]
MKIALFNYSGNVGKTTLARLLAASLPGVKVITLESVNDGVTGEQMRGDDDIDRVQAALIDHDDLILDVGASNAEAFFAGLVRYAGMSDDIDVFVVPVMPTQKAQIDTLRSVRDLVSLGVSPERIRVVFNGVGQRRTAEQEFPAIFAEQALERSFEIDPLLWMPDTPVFNHLRAAGGLSLFEAATDETDYRPLIREERDAVKLERLQARLYGSRAAKPLLERVQRLTGFMAGA